MVSGAFKYVLQPTTTTFAFSSVFIILLWIKKALRKGPGDTLGTAGTHQQQWWSGNLIPYLPDNLSPSNNSLSGTVHQGTRHFLRH